MCCHLQVPQGQGGGKRREVEEDEGGYDEYDDDLGVRVRTTSTRPSLPLPQADNDAYIIQTICFVLCVWWCLVMKGAAGPSLSKAGSISSGPAAVVATRDPIARTRNSALTQDQHDKYLAFMRREQGETRPLTTHENKQFESLKKTVTTEQVQHGKDC